MTTLFLQNPDPGVIEEVANDLVTHASVATQRIRIVTRAPGSFHHLPVRIVHYHPFLASTANSAMLGAVIGALIAMPLIVLGAAGLLPAVIFAVVGGIAGALLQLWRGYTHGLAGRFHRVDTLMAIGDSVAIVDIEEFRHELVRDRVERRYPTVRVFDDDELRSAR